MKDRLVGYPFAHAQLAEGKIETAREYLASRPDSHRHKISFLELWADVAWHSRDLTELRDVARHLASCKHEHSSTIRALALSRIEFYEASFQACIEVTSLARVDRPRVRIDLLAELIRWEGMAWNRIGELSIAADRLRESAKLWKQIGDPGKEAECLVALGTISRTNLRFSKAIRRYDEAIDLYFALQQPGRSIAPVTSRALLLLWQGKEERALRDLSQVVTLSRSIRDDPKLRDSLLASGYARLKCGHLNEARRSLAEAARLNAKLSDRARFTISICEYFAELRFAQNLIGQSRLWIRKGHQLAFAQNSARPSAELLRCEASADLRQGKLLSAIDRAKSAVELHTATGNGPELAVSQRVLAQVLLASNHARSAASVLRSARRTLIATAARPELVRVELLIWEAWYRRQPVSVHPGFPQIVTRNQRMIAILDRGTRIAKYSVSVTIYGETGTGKDLVAEGIHRSSPRKHKPFVALNCATATIFEADIFGYVKGAFTGAAANREGLARAADGGTLFLDEVAELTIEQQAKLLRFLDHGEVRPVGSDETFPVNVRVLCATNRDLRKMVGAGTFRSDLLYRLEEMVLTMPPVRERRDDIPILLLHLIDKAAKRLERPRITIRPRAMKSLRAHSWPGNLRDLQNLALRFVDQGETVRTWTAPVIAASGAEITRERLASALEATGHNVSATADQLGIYRSRLYRLKKRWGL